MKNTRPKTYEGERRKAMTPRSHAHSASVRKPESAAWKATAEVLLEQHHRDELDRMIFEVRAADFQAEPFA